MFVEVMALVIFFVLYCHRSSCRYGCWLYPGSFCYRWWPCKWMRWWTLAPSYGNPSDWYVGVDSGLVNFDGSNLIFKRCHGVSRFLGLLILVYPLISSHQGLNTRLIESHRGHFTCLSGYSPPYRNNYWCGAALLYSDYRGLESSWSDVVDLSMDVGCFVRDCWSLNLILRDIRWDFLYFVR